jgi:hypothetical protein
MAITRSDPASVDAVPDGLGRETEVLADRREGRARLILAGHFVNLGSGRALQSQGGASVLQATSDGCPMDAEVVSQLIDSRSRLIALHQPGQLRRVKPYSPFHRSPWRC